MATREPATASELHPIEQELVARERAAAANGTSMTMPELQTEYEGILAERHERLRQDAAASWRAMAGWGNVKTEEEWQAVMVAADEDYDTGEFLLSRMGGDRYLDPPLMAVLLCLRRRLIEEHEATTAAELMMVDLAVLSYYHTLRINGWIGNFSHWFESEFFRKDSLSIKIHGKHKTSFDVKIRGLTIEEIVERLADKLMPLLDRSNRMMLRNLKALEARRQPPSATVSIGQAGQVNVAGIQSNNGGRAVAGSDTDG
jgi:hypothetical protein